MPRRKEHVVDRTVDAVIDTREAFEHRLASGRGFEGLLIEGVDLSGSLPWV